MAVASGLYAILIEMEGGREGRATGIIILRDGSILGGDSFSYTGSYTAAPNGKAPRGYCSRCAFWLSSSYLYKLPEVP
jgi:hypothetical protein